MSQYRILSEKRLTTAQRNKMPSSMFGEPAKRKYPMPDKKHAAVAKAYASRFASKSQEKKIDAKANKKIFGKRTEDMVYSRTPLLIEKHMGFKKLKASLAHKKNHPKNPGAVAAVIGREKFGKAKFQAMAAKGRKAACYSESIDAIAELKALAEGLVELRKVVTEGIKK